jgi:urease accessory protein
MTALSLLQLVSPALPVGAFSYSEGLEVLIQAATLSDERQIQDWLEAELRQGALRLEAAALKGLSDALRQWRAHGDQQERQWLIDQDSWLLATRESSEVRSQQTQMGASLFQLIKEMGHPLPQATPLSWPSAWAWSAVALDVSHSDMVEGYLYGWVANQLSAAVRLLPLGPSRAQVVQQRLLPLISEQAVWLQLQDPRQLWSHGVGASMAQLAHAELYSRLFRS